MALFLFVGFKSVGVAILKGALAGLAVGIIIAIVMGKAGLFKRDGKFHSVAAKLFYLYIPVALAVFCAAWLALSAMRAETMSLLAQLRPGLIELSAGAAERAGGEITGLTEGRESGEISPPSIAKVVCDRVDEEFSARLRDYPALYSLLKPIRYLISEMLVKRISDILISKLSEASGLPSDSLDAVLANGIIASLREGLFADVVEAQAARIFGLFFGKVRTAGIILALPVLLDVGFFLYRGKKQPQTAGLL
jgi:hypothetical protein